MAMAIMKWVLPERYRFAGSVFGYIEHTRNDGVPEGYKLRIFKNEQNVKTRNSLCIFGLLAGLVNEGGSEF